MNVEAFKAFSEGLAQEAEPDVEALAKWVHSAVAEAAEAG
jgi:hypothetical protein